MESFTLQLDFGRGHDQRRGAFHCQRTADGSIAPLGPRVVASTDMAALGSTDPAGIAYVPGHGVLRQRLRS